MPRVTSQRFVSLSTAAASLSSFMEPGAGQTGCVPPAASPSAETTENAENTVSIISIAMKKAEMRLSSFINKYLPLIISCTHVLHCGAKLASQRGGIGKLPCSRMCNAAMHDCIKLPQRANLLNQPVPHSMMLPHRRNMLNETETALNVNAPCSCKYSIIFCLTSQSEPRIRFRSPRSVVG